MDHFFNAHDVNFLHTTVLSKIFLNILPMENIKNNLIKINIDTHKISLWLKILSLLTEWKQIQEIRLKSLVKDRSWEDVKEAIQFFTKKIGIITTLLIL